MSAGHSHKLLAEAANESIERIRLDRRKAPQRLKPLLAFIEENLFNPTLDVNQLKRICGVRDNSVPIQFHSAVGRPPHGYIEDRRLETACRLLAETHLKIWQISELLGYSSVQVFSRAFSRWSGQRPTHFRKKARRWAAPKPGREERRSASGRKRFDRSLIATESLRQALDGELPVEEAKSLVDRLRALYPESGGASPNLAEDTSEDQTLRPTRTRRYGRDVLKAAGGVAATGLSMPPRQREAAEPEKADLRFVNTWFEGDEPVLPLAAGRRYLFLLDIGARRDRGAAQANAFVEPDFGHHQSVELLVSLHSDDFEIEAPSHHLWLWKDQDSDSVTSGVRPKGPGKAAISIDICLFRELDVLQRLSVEVDVVESRQPLEGAD